ncbi:MAG: hypothetical protein Q3986_01635 [Akkermansia sp.]|nr:hypothetical protein [Akkermansia sp.]
MTKKRAFQWLALGVLALGVASCESATPASRIQANPVIFNSLPEQHRQLVQQGLICQGMGQNAVMLAWGRPDTRATGQMKDGRPCERWEYDTFEPVTTVHTGFGGWYGGGWGPYWYPYGAGGVDTTYIPRCAAWVDFVNGRVDRWMHTGR